MKNIERETIRKDYIENLYKNSWTYERLNETEKQNIIAIMQTAKLYGNDKKQIAEELHYIYSAFLSALNYKPFGWREEPEKLEQVENLIDFVVGDNLCENTKQYIDYLNKDLENLQQLKENTKYMEDECLCNHCIESIVLLQEIICIVKGVKE